MRFSGLRPSSSERASRFWPTFASGFRTTSSATCPRQQPERDARRGARIVAAVPRDVARGTDLSPATCARPDRLVDPAIPLASSISSASPRNRSRFAASSRFSSGSSTFRQPRPVGRQERGAVFGAADRAEMERADPLLARRQVSPGWYITTDALRVPPLQQPRRGVGAEVQGPRPGPARIPARGADLQEQPLSAGDCPRVVDDSRRAGRALIVRSSSLWRTARARPFRQVQEPVHLANQGSKPERLDALLDAIAEVLPRPTAPIRSSIARAAACSTSAKKWGS